MGIGGVVSGASDAARAAAEAASKAAEEAAQQAAAAEKAAQEAAQKATEGAQKATEDVKGTTDKVSSIAADRARDVYEDAKSTASNTVDKAREAATNIADKAEDAASGAANGAKDAASDAADEAKDAASGAVDEAKDAASGAVDEAKDAASGAVDEAKDAASSAVDKVKSFASSAADKAKEVASSAADKAKEVASSAADKAKEVASSTVDKVKDAASGAVDKVKDAADKVRSFASGAAGKAKEVASRANDSSRRAEQSRGSVEAAGEVAPETLQRAAPPAEESKGASRQQPSSDKKDGTGGKGDTVESILSRLHKGDSVSVNLKELEGDVGGFELDGNAQVTLSRNDDGKFTIRAEGELGAGLIAAAGDEVTGVEEAEAQADGKLTGSTAVEFTFDNVEKLKDGLETMGKSALVAAAASAGGPALSPSLGLAAQHLIGPSAEELADLGKNVSAVELAAGVAGDGSAALGALGFKAGTEGELGADATLRLGFDNGRLTDITASAQVHLNNETEAVAGIEGKVSATLSQKYEVPRELSLQDTLAHPSKSMGPLRELQRADEASLTVNVEGKGFLKDGPTKAAVGGSVEVEVRGDLDKLQRSDAMKQLQQGDTSRALREAGKSFDLHSKVRSFGSLEAELKLSAHGGLGGGAVSAGATYERQLGAASLNERQTERLLAQESERTRRQTVRG